MHEWAIAEGIVATALKKSGGKRVKKVKLRVGELQQVDLEILKFAIEEISKAEQGEKMDVEMEVERAELTCSRCSEKWNPVQLGMGEETAELIHFLPEAAKIHLRCPKCGSFDFEISRGRGVWIESLVIQE